MLTFDLLYRQVCCTTSDVFMRFAQGIKDMVPNLRVYAHAKMRGRHLKMTDVGAVRIDGRKLANDAIVL